MAESPSPRSELAELLAEWLTPDELKMDELNQLAAFLRKAGYQVRVGLLDPGEDHSGIPWRVAEDTGTLGGTWAGTIGALVVVAKGD
jgi:hypothetical protein